MSYRKLLLGLVAALALTGWPEPKPVVFWSSDEWHVLSVYLDGRFSLMNNGFDTWYGTCHSSQDTLRLTYDADQVVEQSNDQPPVSVNNLLVRTLVINRQTQRIRGVDGQPFCGTIGTNKL